MDSNEAWAPTQARSALAPGRALLAVDASAGVLSVAVAVARPNPKRAGTEKRGDFAHSAPGCELACWEATADCGPKQTEALIPAVEQALGAAGASRSDIALIAYAAGPGSFTGLRVGLGFCQGLAVALDAPLIPVPTLEATALKALGAARCALCAIDARMGEVYSQWFEIEPGPGGAPLAFPDSPSSPNPPSSAFYPGGPAREDNLGASAQAGEDAAGAGHAGSSAKTRATLRFGTLIAAPARLKPLSEAIVGKAADIRKPAQLDPSAPFAVAGNAAGLAAQFEERRIAALPSARDFAALALDPIRPRRSALDAPLLYVRDKVALTQKEQESKYGRPADRLG